MQTTAKQFMKKLEHFTQQTELHSTLVLLMIKLIEVCKNLDMFCFCTTCLENGKVNFYSFGGLV